MNFQAKNLVFGMSERKDGSMILRYPQLYIQNLENRKKFFKKLDIELDQLVCANLVHGKNVAVISEKDSGENIAETDGLVINQKNLFLTATFADCLPIFFYDEVKNAIGLAHAGWRGVLINIAGEMIDKMVDAYNSKPEDIRIIIGPHLQKCHFEVKNDVVLQFEKYKEFVINKNNQKFIDLLSIVKKQLGEKGVRLKMIETSKVCTYEAEKKYFSFRRDKPRKVEAVVAYIGLT